MWERKDGQTVESAMFENESCEYRLTYEPLGESIAIKHDDSGFSTTSDAQAFAPIYFYGYM